MTNAVSRLAFLKETHRKLDEDIQRGYSCFLDDAKLSKMKIQKLRIKDQIDKMEQEQNESNG